MCPTRRNKFLLDFRHGMNQTGLSQSMQPIITSLLMSSPPPEENWLRLSLPFFPTSVKFFNQNKIPYVFSVSPLLSNPECIKPPKQKMVPRCKNCNALPSEFCKVSSNTWKCAVCNNENQISSNIFIPRLAEYDIKLEKKNEKPLFFFIVQNTSFFLNPEARDTIGQTLDIWAKSAKADVALVALDKNITIFDLDKPSSLIFIEPENFSIPISSSSNANFLKAFRTLSPSIFSKELLFLQLNLLLKCIRRKSVCLCLFANLIKEPEGFDNYDENDTKYEYRNEMISLINILKTRQFSIHLFSDRKDADCPKFVKYCDRVRLFDKDCTHLISPELLKFLKSGFLFRSQIYFYSPPPFELMQISARKNVTSSKITLTSLDGQMSLIPQYKMKYAPTKSVISFQVTIDGIKTDGQRLLRVLNFISRGIAKIEKFDGIIFGCYIARKVSVEAYFDSIENAYKKFREDCINLISSWSDEGNYKRAILNIFRDVPLLLYAIQNSDLFRRGSTSTESAAMMVNLMGSTIEDMRRMLYPIMLLPPLNFPHRLQKSSIGQFKLVIFLREYDGIAVVFDDKQHSEEIEEVSQKYCLPITLYTDPTVADKFLLEDNSITFSQYAEKLEVEVNGRRF